MKKIEELGCYSVLKYFEKINEIPRGSGNEKAISDFLVNFAKERSLQVFKDNACNVIIKKDGVGEFKNSKPVIIQGHMDMVCEKDSDSLHNFEKDPIKVIYENGFIRANGTTLGADDGIAVAMGLALLDSDYTEHPPLEVVFTTDEEVGMHGAEALDTSMLEGKVLLNIDSEREGVFTLACAGGIKVHSHIPLEYESANDKFLSYCVDIKGLKGGHSGLEIDKQRANANVLMARLLNSLFKDFHIKISSVFGGTKDNAIPRKSEAVISFAEEDYNSICEKISEIKNEFSTEFGMVDPDIDININKTDNPSKYFKDSIARNVVSLILLLPNGVQTMSMDVSGLVESSNNIGVVKTQEDEVTVVCAVRSSVPSLKYYIYDKIYAVSCMVGGSVSYVGDYPAWEYNKDSAVREIFVDEYKKMFLKSPEFEIAHAGLECGIFSKKIENIDAISFGPNLYDVHTTKEKADIMSIDRTWSFLLAVLKKFKN